MKSEHASVNGRLRKKLQKFKLNANKINFLLKHPIALRIPNGYCTDATEEANPNIRNGK